MKREVIFRLFRIFLVIVFVAVLSYFRDNISESYEIRDSLGKNIVVDYLSDKVDSSKKPCSDEDGEKSDGYLIKVSNKNSNDESISFVLDELKNDYGYGYGYLKYEILKNDEVVKVGNVESNLVLFDDFLKENSYDIYEIKFWVDEDAPSSVIGKNFSFKITLI